MDTKTPIYQGMQQQKQQLMMPSRESWIKINNVIHPRANVR